MTNPILAFSSISALQEKNFSRLWQLCGSVCAQDTPPSISSVLSQSKGLILDVGPGYGHQLFRFSNVNGIKLIYGVEPGHSLHNNLALAAKNAGLEGKYKIIGTGAEPEFMMPALVQDGVIKVQGDAVFDEIVCLRVLCGVTKPKETIEGLYGLLKPGGRMVVFEHVVNSGDSQKGGSYFSSILQQLYMFVGWKFWLSGCELNRDTAMLLMDAAKVDGGWEEVKLELLDGWGVVPHIAGYLVKKK